MLDGATPDSKASQASAHVEDDFDTKSQNSSDTESEMSDFDPSDMTLSRMDPNYGLSAISTVLVPRIYESFFTAERHDGELKQSLLPQVLEQMVLISKLLLPEQRDKLIVPIILGCLNDKEDDSRRTMGVQLLDELADILGSKLCQERIMYDLISL